MIRIVEIYENIFVPDIAQRANSSAHWFDPFGSTQFTDLCSRPSIDQAHRRYLFWDQEPMHKDSIDATISEFTRMYNGKYHIITSEYSSDMVDYVCDKYNFTAHYYWFHGWAALDWYRGYNRTNLMPEPGRRSIRKTFIMPNRIIGGRRQHRLKMLYWIFKYKLMDNYISCPDICPAEGESVKDLLLTVALMREDAVEVFDSAALPLNMPNEQGHPMHSCWLSLFDESAECLLYLVTETVASGRRQHLTEKIFKPICLRMPFILVGTAGSLEYLRSYGFKTFATVWDESYDTIEDDDLRIAAIAELLKNIDQLPAAAKQDLFRQCADIIEHNYHHFYSGAFEEILWQELQSMLAEF